MDRRKRSSRQFLRESHGPSVSCPRMLKAPGLRAGDTVGVIAPSGPAHSIYRARYETGLSTLQRLGFRVIEGSLAGKRGHQGYRTGSPGDRARELMELFVDPQVRAVVATIGGLNSASLIPYLDFGKIRDNPKVFCGYSDVTALHMAIWTQSRLSTFYGPAVVPSFGEPLPGFSETQDSFLDATMRHLSGARELAPPSRWSNQAPRFADPLSLDAGSRTWREDRGWTTLVPGVAADGPVICANLNTLVSLAGTIYFPDLTGRILAIEEMAAPFSRLERNLRHLQLLGVFERLAGLIVSKPEMPDSEGAPFSEEELVAEIVGRPNYPVVTNFDCGHTHPMLTIAQGTRMRLCADTQVSVTALEPMVSTPIGLPSS